MACCPRPAPSLAAEIRIWRSLIPSRCCQPRLRPGADSRTGFSQYRALTTIKTLLSAPVGPPHSVSHHRCNWAIRMKTIKNDRGDERRSATLNIPAMTALPLIYRKKSKETFHSRVSDNNVATSLPCFTPSSVPFSRAIAVAASISIYISLPFSAHGSRFVPGPTTTSFRVRSMSGFDFAGTISLTCHPMLR